MAENSNPQIKKAGVAVGRAYALNFIEGANVTLTVAASGESTDVTIAATAGVASAVDNVTFAGNVA